MSDVYQGLTYSDAVFRSLGENPDILGRTQITFFTGGRWQTRVGTYLAGTLGLRADDGELLVKELIVLIGLGITLESAAKDLKAAMVKAIDTLRLAAVMNDQTRALIDEVRFISVDDWSMATVENVVSKVSPKSVIAIVRAADYRDSEVVTATMSGEAELLGSDEVWVPHLIALVGAMARQAEELDVFILLDTGQPGLTEDVLLSFQDIAGCQILNAPRLGPEAEINRRMAQWRTWLGEGRIGPVLQELDAIPSMEEDHRLIVRIQLLDAGGMGEQALAGIHEIECFDELSANVAAKLARIAAEANALDLAGRLLAFDLDDIVTCEDLQNTLIAADRSGHDALATQAEAKLATSFPGSTVLANHRRAAALELGDHRAAAEALLGSPESAELIAFHLRVADALKISGVPDYDGLIDEAGSDALLASRYRLASVADARERGLPVHAFELLMTPAAIARGEGSQSLIDAIKRLLIHRPGGVMALSEDRLVEAITVLVGRMAKAPLDKALRVNMCELIEPEISGDLGRTMMLWLLMKLAANEVEPKPRTVPLAGPPLDEILRDPNFRSGLEHWMKTETPVRVGRTVFPKDKLTFSADAICQAIIDQIDLSTNYATADDHEARLLMVALCAAIAPHADEQDLDLKAMRTGAAGMMITGSGQPARDLIEGMLDRPTTSRRRRLAWFGLADIYHRGNDILLATLYACAGLLADEDVDEDQLWHEAQVLNHIFRDAHLVKPALAVLARARHLLERMDLIDEYAHRIETMAILTRFANLEHSTRIDEDIFEMTTDALSNGRAVLDHHDTPGPIASLLAQLLRHCRERGISPPDGADDLDKKLRAALGGSLAAHIDIYARDAPTAEDLLTLVQHAGPVRYSDDVGKDARNVAMTASRALDTDDLLADAASTIFALEMMADRAIAVPGWDGSRVPPPVPERATEPEETAQSISSAGIAVIIAGFARNGSLVRVTLSNGVTAAQREDPTVFGKANFDAWSVRFPYDYGMDETFANRFFVTTASLHFSSLPPGPTVLITDTKLSSFPPNLLRIGKSFAGLEHGMASAPSLSWLKTARARGSHGDGRRVAWISGAETDGTTLSMIADRIETPLANHGFYFDRGQKLPEAFRGASLAIMAAHGGLNRDQTAFQVVADEGHLAVTADELASTVHNVGIVILFVCSGGRFDRHPAADATLGLAREILDNGSSAVISSPWPLDSVVPPRWLPAFLKSWDAGDRLIDAVFNANQAVLAYWPHDLAKGLAMTLIGNPELSNE